jgi:bifunctional isochorismate lyase/aryl carrier protein
MAIPTIAAYPLPTAAELPANRVHWRLDPARAALLIHDMQHWFTDRFAAGDLLDEVVERIATLRKHATDLGIPVLYTAQPGGQSPAARGLLQDFWGPGLPADPRAEAILDRLAPAPGDHVVTKHRYSAFEGTNVAHLLGRRDQLVITGVYAHIGVQTTAVDGFMRGVQAFVVADAVADFSADDHTRALRWVADRCGMVLTTDAVVDALAGNRI